MPVVFQLTKKGEEEPMVMQKIDEELCKHLGVEVHPTEWVTNWYNDIGFRIACGHSLSDDQYWTGYEQERRVHACSWEEADKQIKVLRYLREHFTDESWREFGRRG